MKRNPNLKFFWKIMIAMKKVSLREFSELYLEAFCDEQGLS